MAERDGTDERHQCLGKKFPAHKRMTEEWVMGSVQEEVGETKSRDHPLMVYVE